MTRPVRWVGAHVARAGRWLRRRRGDGDDQGFALLESIITITLIAFIMSAVGAEFITHVTSSADQRARQIAVQLADSAIETIRALHPSDLVTGRDAGSVNTQFSSAPVTVRPWLDEMSPAKDTGAVTGSGATAAIPTVAQTQKPGSIGYSVSQYLGWCDLTTASGTTKCTPTGLNSGMYLRAVVAVTWPGTRCHSNLCDYITTTLVSTADDPIFRINEALPPPPVVDPPGNQTSAVGDQVSLQLTIQDGTGVAPLTWARTNGALPAGLSLDVTGLISGTPTTTVNSLAVTITVTDAFLRTASVSFSWTVVPALKITPVADKVNTTGDSVNTTLSASGGTTPYVWSDPSGTLPPGLTLNAGTGVISGTPTTAGTYAVTIKVTDSGKRTDMVSFSWLIRSLPTLVNPGDQLTRVNTQVTLRISASGGTGALTYSASGLPNWLNLDPNTGVITGTSPVGRSVTTGITVTVTDSVGTRRTSAAFSWTVTNLSIAVPNQLTVRNANVRFDLDDYVTGTAAVTSITVTGALPSGLTYSSTTHVISGTAGSNGTWNGITATVTDADGVTATATFNWRVVSSTTVTWGTVPRQSTLPNTAVSLNVTGYVTGETASATWSATGLPPGLSINSSGVISGTPTAPGRYAVTVSVTDSAGLAVPSQPFVWQVTDLAWASIPNQTGRWGQPDSLNAKQFLSGGTGPFSFSVSSPPSSLSIDASTGVISGTLWGSSSNVQITVTDSTGVSVTSNTFTWSVTA